MENQGDNTVGYAVYRKSEAGWRIRVQVVWPDCVFIGAGGAARGRGFGSLPGCRSLKSALQPHREGLTLRSGIWKTVLPSIEWGAE